MNIPIHVDFLKIENRRDFHNCAERILNSKIIVNFGKKNEFIVTTINTVQNTYFIKINMICETISIVHKNQILNIAQMKLYRY